MYEVKCKIKYITNNPSNTPTFHPTKFQLVPTFSIPTYVPSHYPSYIPTNTPSLQPTYNPFICKMVNYIPNSKTLTDSRCYIFNKQCVIKKNENNEKNKIVFKRI